MAADTEDHFSGVAADIEEFADWTRDWRGAEPGSDLEQDRATLGFPSSADAMLYMYFLSVADHLCAVVDLVGSDLGVPMFSPFTLLRSAHETISRILWLLAPDISSERVRRLRLCALQERVNIVKCAEDLGTHALVEKPVWFDDALQDMRDGVDEIHTLICRADCGRNANHLLTALNAATITAEAHAILDIREQTLRSTPGGFGRGVWRLQSGVAHGLIWTTEFTVTATHHESNADRLALTSNPRLLALNLRLHMFYAKHAARLYHDRATASG
ncbi:hypothetical protein [Nocardia wallacei]|uniref:hypothetical protein n=1 Tax=Nocardia wallacei TaxID=480035 RepID=UPI00245641C2|nr:hypothetical protein [Nocardia wallacei]